MAAAAFALAFIGLLPGCGQDQGVKLVAVQGKVTVGGKLLHKGHVMLYPDASRGNASMDLPRAMIDAEGNYSIKTNLKDGVAPGWYLVAVTAADQPDPKNAYKFKHLLPERYLEKSTSKLAYEVVENPEAGRYDLNLDAE
jgi:hypothetical protein